MSQTQIRLLRNQIGKLSDPEFEIDAWKQSTIILLSQIFGHDSQAPKSIGKIKYRSIGVYREGGCGLYSDNLIVCKKQGREILEACIVELETARIPEKG